MKLYCVFVPDGGATTQPAVAAELSADAEAALQTKFNEQQGAGQPTAAIAAQLAVLVSQAVAEFFNPAPAAPAPAPAPAAAPVPTVSVVATPATPVPTPNSTVSTIQDILAGISQIAGIAAPIIAAFNPAAGTVAETVAEGASAVGQVAAAVTQQPTSRNQTGAAQTA